MPRNDALERPRRFWKTASVGPRGEEGWPILLDGRPLRTPAKHLLAAPTQVLATLIAAEWDAQGEHVRPETLAFTRLAHTAIDAVPNSREAVAAEVARYADSDALCYFAQTPAVLIERQAVAWTPWLDWAERELDVRLERTEGIIHRPQPQASIVRIKALALALDDFALTALAAATPLFGSAVLGLAFIHGALNAPAALELSRVDEAFQIEQWGQDEEAAERAAGLRAEAQVLHRWLEALQAV